MHPQKLDQGEILLQTPQPGFDIPNPDEITAGELIDFVAPKAAELLMAGLEEQIFVPPLVGQGLRQDDTPGRLARHAPKITTKDSEVSWTRDTAEQILRKFRVSGSLWTSFHVHGEDKRVIWCDGFEEAQIPEGESSSSPLASGEFFLSALTAGAFVRTCDGKLLHVKKAKLSGKGVMLIGAVMRQVGLVNE